MGFLVCFGLVIILHCTLLVMESQLDLNTDTFVATTFHIAWYNKWLAMMFGCSVFLGWFKMFEYLRLTQSFAIMFFIIVGMIEKVRSIMVIDTAFDRYS